MEESLVMIMHMYRGMGQGELIISRGTGDYNYFCKEQYRGNQ